MMRVLLHFGGAAGLLEVVLAGLEGLVAFLDATLAGVLPVMVGCGLGGLEGGLDPPEKGGLGRQGQQEVLVGWWAGGCSAGKVSPFPSPSG